jgi:alpha,alpha-trehalase
MPEAPFERIEPVDGYLPIEDFGLIGDGSTSALVGRDGAVSWLCVPRFDADPLFCKILDTRRGGAFTVAPADLAESRQYYEPETGVLITELRGRSGLVRVTDALTLRSGCDLNEDVPAARGELLRSVEVLEGSVELRVEVEPRGGAEAERRGDGLRLRCAGRQDLDLQLWSSRKLSGLRSRLELAAGDRLHLTLRWGGGHYRHHPVSPEATLDSTVEVWRRWSRQITYEGPQKRLVRRSAITLKLLDYFQTGAIVAAPTSSLPEAIGGPRNWDYRYAWIRDAAFSVYALNRIGLPGEAAGFLGWVLEAVERHGRPKILYDMDGEDPQPEWEDEELEGYRKSPPVRWGNAAADQRQHDVFGEILDCAYQWVRSGGELDEPLWKRLSELVEAAGREWHDPDHGIWEVRTPGRPFTYSAALCQVALDRGARLAEQSGFPADVKGWRTEAEKIRQAILDEAWDEEIPSLTEHLGGGGLDASLLSLPLRRVIPANHPRMVATTAAVVDRLGAGDGLIYRYLPDESPDGLPGHEGAFLLCSFWLVDNLAGQGRLEEALELYDSLCERANPPGLLPEQIDPGSGAFLGNYPQAFSHVGVISSGVNLARKTGQMEVRV